MKEEAPDGFDLGDLDAKEKMVRDGFWAKIRRAAGSIDFAREAVAAWYCATDPATPLRVKAILIGALAYFILPTDVIPDVIVGLGFTDDAAVFWAAWKAVSGHIDERHRSKAAAALDGDNAQDPDVIEK
ncbi:MAG: DUF1232 domain-containing protein [Alphaproteobacteria bacterium]|nr:DUF1232 domain-containing protein [Alphaproteobacteria bacterium]